MQIFVKDTIAFRGKTITLEVNPSDTIHSLMQQVEEQTGTPPILQRLMYNCQQLFHDAPGTLADHNITKDASLYTLYTVSGLQRLKDKTLEALGIAVDGGDDDDPDDSADDSAGGSGGEEKDDPRAQQQQQMAVGKMRIDVKDYMMPGSPRTITMEVEAGETVAGVMEAVRRRRRYPVAMQRLTCDGGRRMHPDGGATLADYNVTEDSELELDMDMDFAIGLDREERRLKKAKEVATYVEQRQQN